MQPDDEERCRTEPIDAKILRGQFTKLPKRPEPIAGEDGTGYLTIAEPDVVEIENQEGAIVRRAEALTIQSVDEYTDAGEFLIDLRRLVKTINAEFKKPIADADVAHRNLIRWRGKHRDPLQTAERVVIRQMTEYRTAQKRIQFEAEEAERKRRHDEAEIQRLRDAESLEDAGQPEAAAAIIEDPIVIAPVVIPTRVPDIKGISRPRKIWKFRVVDSKAIPIKYMVVNEKAIGAVVRALKDEHGIPGIVAYTDETTAVSV